MPNTPYDNLIAGDSDKPKKRMVWRSWLPDDLNFDEWIVDYLLDRYDLAGTVTKFCLLDIEKQQHGPVKDKHGDVVGQVATTGSFCGLFPDFPMAIGSVWLTKQDASRVTVPRFFLGLGDIPAVQQVWFAAANLDGDSNSPPLAMVVGGLKPKMSIADSPVMHTRFPMNENIPGPHMLYTDAEGVKMGVERLGTLLDNVDQDVPPEVWMETALNADYAKHYVPK